MSEVSIVPSLARGVKFRFDEVRQAWVLLAPERLFVPDEQAVEILKLVDGARSLDMIVDELAARFDAPRDLIAKDVGAMLADLSAKGAIRL
jgi:pyrroloquinoline quinone biosynthesis protein D